MKTLLWTHRRSVALKRRYAAPFLILLQACMLVNGFFADPRSKVILTLMATSPSSDDDGYGAATTAATETGTSRNLEVERKFSLLGANLDSLSDRLRQAGLKETGTKEMVDWYFDLCSPSSLSSARPRYPLIRQDCWLRYRTTTTTKDGINNVGSGTWQLKRGRKVNQNSSGTTIYEETEGEEALKIIQTLLFPSRRLREEHDSNTTSKNGCTVTQTTTTTTAAAALFDGVFDVPPIPISGMQPFARIATKRSSWIISNGDNDDGNNGDDSSFSSSSNNNNNNNNQHIRLTVDLDTTDFGHAIGEVEAVVTNEQDVAMAQAKIDDLVERLQVGSSSDGAATIIMGKLECYLKLKRPEILQLIMEGFQQRANAGDRRIMEGSSSTPTPGTGDD